MKEVHKVAIVLLAVLALVLCYYNGAFTNMGYPPPGTQQPNYNPNYYPNTQVPSGTSVGTFNVVDNAYNTLDISAALSIGSIVDQSFWAFRNGGWILLGTHAALGTNIEVVTADQGYIYIMMKPHAASTYIADVAKVMTMNSRAVAAQFIDADGDNLKEFMIKYSMANLPAAASGYPSTTFTGYYLYENSASASVTGGTSLTSVAAPAKISYFAPFMTVGTVDRGVAVTKVELKVNDTSTAEIQLVSVNIPGRGLVLASACAYQLTDTYQYWTYVIGTDLSTAVLWTYASNTYDKQDLTFGCQSTLTSGTLDTWTITVYMLNYAQTTITESATQYLALP